MSYLVTNSNLRGPQFHDAWRGTDGGIHATVYLNSRDALFFDSADDARAVAAACAQAAEAHDRLAAETGPVDPTPGQDGGQ